MHHQQQYNQCEIINGFKNQNSTIISYYTKRLTERVQRNFEKRYSEYQQSWIDDSIAESIVILLNKVDEIPDQSLSLDNYVFGIVKYSFYRFLRKSSRVDYHATENLPESLEESSEIYHSVSELFNAEGHDKHWLWYNTLSLRNRQILDLKAQGYSSKEIAVKVGLKDGSVRNIIGRLMRDAKKLAA